MRFTYIKHRPGKSQETKLKWTSQDAEHDDHMETELVSGDDPAPEFVSAFEALKPHVLRLLDLPAGYGDGLTIHTVQLYWNEKERWRAVISGSKKVESTGKPFNISTPSFAQPADDSSYGKSGVVDRELEGQLVELIGLANAFRKGVRAQQSLELDEDEDEDGTLFDGAASTDEEDAPAAQEADEDGGKGFRPGEIPADEEEPGKAPGQASTDAPVIEIFRNGQRRAVVPGKTLIVVGSAGVHSGDHLRVLDVDAERAVVALWDDDAKTPIGEVLLEDVGWSDAKGRFITLEVNWYDQEEEPGPFDQVPEEAVAEGA